MVGTEKCVAVVRRDSLQLGLSDSHVRVIEHHLDNPHHALVAKVGREIRYAGNDAYPVICVRLKRLLTRRRDVFTHGVDFGFGDDTFEHAPSLLSQLYQVRLDFRTDFIGS